MLGGCEKMLNRNVFMGTLSVLEKIAWNVVANARGAMLRKTGMRSTLASELGVQQSQQSGKSAMTLIRYAIKGFTRGSQASPARIAGESISRSAIKASAEKVTLRNLSGIALSATVSLVESQNKKIAQTKPLSQTTIAEKNLGLSSQVRRKPARGETPTASATESFQSFTTIAAAAAWRETADRILLRSGMVSSLSTGIGARLAGLAATLKSSPRTIESRFSTAVRITPTTFNLFAGNATLARAAA